MPEPEKLQIHSALTKLNNILDAALELLQPVDCAPLAPDSQRTRAKHVILAKFCSAFVRGLTLQA